MNNIYILNKNYKQIGVLSNQGANPQAPYYDDLYIQELDTGADTYQFSTISSKYTQDLLEIGNHVMFSFNNRNEIFTITSLEYSHYEGYKTIGVYAEGIGFELLEVFMERPPIKKYPSGNDSDGDGDDNTDDEYGDPDDIYIDENGNIIYDENGSGPPSEDDVYIDEDGFIIYKPDRKKEKNDSLEFKNISFPTFLKILLKDTGWNYTCQSGLSSVKHDINVRYDTNIYAVLQDSMQAYRGVELEFVHEMRNGKVQKIVKAYKDGGRGSVVGKRFEYGTNVKGITKTQEVTDSEDDTVLYVDDVGVKVYYDVDFALKSAEIPEIEIGDTHYVIDKDFYPPMTIKARIGKIEISFTDPTKNKIYLANNKNIRGSSDEEDIRDILDDYFDDPGYDDPGYGDEVGPHDHDRLVNGNKIVSYTSNGCLIPNTISQNIGTEENYWHSLFTDNMHTNLISTNFVDIPFDRDDVHDVSEITDSSDVSKEDLLDLILNKIKVYKYAYYDRFDGSAGYTPILGILSEDFVDHDYNINKSSDCESKSKATNLVMSRYFEFGKPDVHKKHRYDLTALVTALIGAFQKHAGDELLHSGISDGGIDLSDYATIVYVNEAIARAQLGDENGEIDLSNYATITYVDEKVGYLEDFTLSNCNNLNGLIMEKTEALDTRVKKLESGSGSNPSNPGEGGGELPSDAFEIIDGKLHINLPVNFEEKASFINCGLTSGRADLTGVDRLDAMTMYCANINPVYDGSGIVTIQGNLVVEGTISSSSNHGKPGSSDSITCKELILKGTQLETGATSTITTPIKFTVSNNSVQTLGSQYIEIEDNVYMKNNLYIEGSLVGVDALESIDFADIKELAVSTITGRGTDAVPTVNFDGNIKVSGVVHHGGLVHDSDKSLKENIRYIDDLVKVTNDDLLEKADLHDFIVNQVNLCEFNFIGDDSDKIGFIANDYEGTKVGDKIVSRYDNTLAYDVNNLLFATIGALQEEVRIKDEKIASLEARLAKIEEMLGINNN